VSAGVVHRLRLGPSDRADAYYRYLPVSLDGEVGGLTVSLDYDRSSAVVDLGLWGPEGFRGWSGGARDRFTVAPDWATPGYLPGPVGPGEYQVALGLYRVPPGGVEVVVEARPRAVPRPEDPPSPPVPEPSPLGRPPAGPGRRWVAGDLHAHTEHSDGSHSIEELAALARSTGLDFLAVTDHNTVSHHRHLESAGRRYGMTLIPGQEVTTPEGHANCLGDIGLVDFRGSSDRWAEHCLDAGGLLSINHPVAGDWAWRRPMERLPDLVEVWHWTWDRRDDNALRWWQALGVGVGVGGSDYHRPGESFPGRPTTWVEVDDDGAGPPSVAAVLDALGAGRVAISAGPDSPVAVRAGDRVVVRDGDGTCLVTAEGASRPVVGALAELPAPPGPLRLIGPDGVALALVP
ncbi:MAG: CehA/McbA family metallohydrolase, partial [Acidimicrobiales bacterium]